MKSMNIDPEDFTVHNKTVYILGWYMWEKWLLMWRQVKKIILNSKLLVQLISNWAWWARKGHNPSFGQILISFEDALCQVWFKLAQWNWRRWKCEKFTIVTMRPSTTTENGQNLIRKAHLNLWLRWAKKDYKPGQVNS